MCEFSSMKSIDEVFIAQQKKNTNKAMLEAQVMDLFMMAIIL